MRKENMADIATDQHCVEVRRIEQALDAILCAIEEHQRLLEADAVRAPRKLEPISWAELATKDLSPVADILSNPVGASLRRGIRELGRRLFVLGGTELMGKVLDRVAEMGGIWGVRVTILDKRWDGIGNASDSWLA